MHEQTGRAALKAGKLSAPLLATLLWVGEMGQALAYAGPQGNEAVKVVDPARGWDHLWHEVIVDITVIGIIFALITAYFIFAYRRRPGNENGKQPKLSPAATVGWIVIPMFLFLADDLYLGANGWALWNAYRDVPADRMEVQLESGMYSWDYTYSNGVKTQNTLVVPAGKPVLLRMTSRDTIHSHFIPDFRVKEDSMPGRVTYLWFNPTKPGEHVVTCAEYCGVMHGYMAGQIVVKSPEEYAAWMKQQEAQLAAASTEGADKAADSKNAKGAKAVAAKPKKT